MKFNIIYNGYMIVEYTCFDKHGILSYKYAIQDDWDIAYGTEGLPVFDSAEQAIKNIASRPLTSSPATPTSWGPG